MSKTETPCAATSVTSCSARGFRVSKRQPAFFFIHMVPRISDDVLQSSHFTISTSTTSREKFPTRGKARRTRTLDRAAQTHVNVLFRLLCTNERRLFSKLHIQVKRCLLFLEILDGSTFHGTQRSVSIWGSSQSR